MSQKYIEDQNNEDFKYVMDKKIREIEKKLNNRPRKVLG
jgi:IS30 family transposase